MISPAPCYVDIMSLDEIIIAFQSDEKGDGPVEAAPLWLAPLIEALGAGTFDDKPSAFLLSLVDRSRRWQRLGDAAWRRILIFFAADCIQLALDVAAPRQSDVTQVYWDDARAACTLVVAALRGEGDLAQATSVAGYAARAWESEAIAGNRKKQAAPHDATWAIKCAADTASWVTQAIMDDAKLIAYAAESAVASGGSHRFLIKRLSALIGTEFAATRGWNPPLSFS